MKQAFIIWAIATSVMAQLDPTDPNNQSTNSAPQIGSYTEQEVEHGAIITAKMTRDSISWWDIDGMMFDVMWCDSLISQSWSIIGSGNKQYYHNNPDGFYAVVERWDRQIIPVSNSGTTNMIWGAYTDCPWLSIECVNTNVPAEQSSGYIIANYTEIPEIGSEGIITVYTIGALTEQTQKCTVVHGGW